MMTTRGNIGELLFSQTEHERQLNEWNTTEVEYPSSSCIQDLFLQQVKSNPSAQAIILENKRIYTYQELDYLSNQVASFLIRNGIKEQSRILVLLPASIDFAATVLGVLKAGCIYVPVDISVGEEQLQFILEDIETEVLITTEELKERYYGFSNHIFSSEDFKIENKAFVHNLGSANNVAYIVYSLASTSQSKGISITHRSLVNSVYARGLHFPIPKRLAILYSTSLDITTATLFWAITTGASLVIPSESRGWDIKSALALIEREQISHLIYPPILYRKLLQQAEQSELKSLEVVSLRGDSWPPDILEHHCIICPQANLYNEYGAKEATTWSSLAQVYDSKTKACKEVTIGNPIANTQTYVFNEREQLVPVGVKGEIYLGGVGLAQGYWDHSELNDICFVKHPYKLGERLYKTGDIGCYLEDGRIEYIGKKECQVRVQERRVELERVEYVLRQQQKVAEVVVLLRRVQSGQERLVGYIQLEEKKPEDTTVIEERLQRNLGKQLPIYMIPQIWVFVDRFEITLEGRIDKKNLPEPPREKLNDNIIAPRTEAEKCLAQIWCKILQLEQVSVRDNFFEVGGDSILSIQLVSEARQMGIEINMEQVFESPTIEELAGVAKLSSEHPIIEKGQGVLEQPITLAPIQQWFLEQTVNNAHHYNQAVILESVEDLDPECLEKALQSLIQTHSSLRLRFRQEVSGEWKQQYEPYESLKEYSQGICRIESLEALAEEDIQEKRLSLMNEVQQSLNIIKGPVFQGILFKGQEKDNLFLVCHHLMIDSVSWRILLEDLEKAYKEIHQSGVASLAPEGKSYSWWTHRLIDLVQEQSWKEELGYWEKVLADSQSVLPQWIANEEANTVASLSEVTFELSVRETQQLLQEVPRAYKTQINDVLLTALGFAIKEWTGLDDISLMLEGHGREQLTEEMDLSRTIGWFTSVYPVSFSLAGVEGLGDGIKLVKESLRAIPKKGIGYGMLRYLTSEGRERLSNKKEPELSFNYLGQWDNSIQKNNLFNFAKGSVGNCIALTNQRPRIIEINCQVMNGVLSIHVGYSVNHYQEEKARGLGEKFVERLRALIHHCCEEKHFGYTPSDFPLAKLNQEQLNLAFGSVANIEDIYPLSPMQEGLLFQKLFKPNSQAYLVQSMFVIRQPINTTLFQKAWQLLINNYEVIRTGFKWENLTTALQFVQQNVELPWNEYNWQDANQQKLQEKLEQLLLEDRQQEFNYENPPLMRFRLIIVSDNFYYFIWTFHHLLLDGWCSSILMNSLLMVYSRLIERRIPKFHVHKPYRMFIEWLQSYDYQQSKGFWKKYLENINLTNLGREIIRKNEHSERHEFANYQFNFSEEQTKILKDFTKTHKITLNTLFQAAWSILLQYYTQQNDVVFGITMSGRTIPIEGIEKMVGLFINTLPLRVNLNTQTSTIQDLINVVAEHSLQLQKSAHVPLFEIQSWAGIKEQSALFDTVLIFENYRTTPIEEESESLLKLELLSAYEPTEYPFTLLVVPRNKILLDITYKKEHFSPQKVSKIISHFENIILSITEDIYMPLRKVNPILEEERAKIFNVYNNTDADYPDNETIHQLFEKQVVKTPEKIALVYNNDSLNFHELNVKSNQLAYYLLKTGVQLGQTISVSLERSPQLIISILAILKVGAVYVPIDPIYPTNRIKFILEDSQSVLFITSKTNKKEDELFNVPQFYIDKEILDNYPTKNPLHNIPIGADIIYTSGSTGNPKGILQTHKGRLNRFHWMWDKYPFTPDDVCCQKAPIGFSDAIWETLGPLLKGVKLIILSNETAKDPSLLIQELNNHKVTRIVLVPSVLQSIVDIATSKNITLEYLKICIVSGENCPASLAKKFLNFSPETLLLNIYGSTEVCADATCYEATSSDSITNLPIGKPLNNFHIYILDKNLNLLAPGIAGEMCISGIGVVNGYLNNEELSKAKFIKNPFSTSDKHKLLFKTGDIARLLEDGNIEYLGRNDAQVKIRGCRIELGEIQEVLMSHPLVKDAVALVKGQDLGDELLVAYVIAKKEVESDDSNYKTLNRQLMEYLSEKLPAYTLPNYLVILNEFPLTTNGKIDQATLKSDKYVKITNYKEIQPPVSNLECELCEIWSQLLNIVVNDINLNFFEIGGHSILATKLIVQIRQKLRLDVPIKVIFQYPAVANLAEHLEAFSNQYSILNLDSFNITPVNRNIHSYILTENETEGSN